MDPLPDLLPLPPHTFLVLLVLRKPLHGYGIKKAVLERSAGRIDLDAGGLYRLIGRLESRGVLRVAEPPVDEPDDDRRRVFYELTPAGRELLAAEARRLAALVGSPDVAALLGGAGA